MKKKDKDEAFRHIMNLVGSDEEAAMEIVAALASKFKWSGTYLTKTDIAQRAWHLFRKKASFSFIESVHNDPRFYPGLSDYLNRQGAKGLDKLLRLKGEQRGFTASESE